MYHVNSPVHFMQYSTRSKVRSPPQSSPRRASEYGHPGESPEARTMSRSHHHHDGRSSTPVEERYSYRPEHKQVSPEPRLLDSLLGKDVDGYLKEHMAMYDKSVARWTECEMSEWVAGAGGNYPPSISMEKLILIAILRNRRQVWTNSRLCLHSISHILRCLELILFCLNR